MSPSTEPPALKNRLPASFFRIPQVLPALLAPLTLWLAPAMADQTFLLDFGGGNRMEEGEDEFYWNNVTSGVADSNTGVLRDLVDSTGLESAIDLVMIARFNGVNENGTQDPTIYPVDATRDSWFGNTEAFGVGSDFYPSFKLTELDPGTAYTLTFYASRLGVNDNRETQYTVTGATTETAFLNVANNIDQVATVAAMKPDAAGEITILLEPGPNNNNSNHFTYLGVLRIDAAPEVMVPVSFTKEPEDVTVEEFAEVTFTAAAGGTPPLTIQWLMDGQPIAGATQLSYTIPAADRTLDGTKYSVRIGNAQNTVTSREAVLRVTPDNVAPTLVSAESPGPWRVSLTFSEPMEPSTATEFDRYQINDGAVPLNATQLSEDGKTVHLFLAEPLSGSASVSFLDLTDRAGNPLAAPAATVNPPPLPDGKSLLFDFGSNGTGVDNTSIADDPLNAWNNVRANFARFEGNVMTDLVNTRGEIVPDWSLEIVSPFNGDNTNGTTASPLYPVDATRDSLYGNTASFNGLENVTPIFKLTGLTPGVPVDFSFFASRMLEPAENRETVYTVTGANEKTASLDPANNLTNTAEVAGVLPTPEGEITISLTPGPNNVNANLFTYLGVMKVTPRAADPGGEEVTMLPPELRDGKIIVNWTGTGVLEWSTSLSGPWTPVAPAPSSPYLEDVVPGQRKFFRVRK